MSIPKTLTTLTTFFFGLSFHRMANSLKLQKNTFSRLPVFPDSFGLMDSKIYDSKTWAAPSSTMEMNGELRKKRKAHKATCLSRTSGPVTLDNPTASP